MSKSIVIECNGRTENGDICRERVSTVCEPQITEVYLPGWLRRKVTDEYTTKKNGSQSFDRLFHYCPKCIDRADPCLDGNLIGFRHRFLDDEQVRTDARGELERRNARLELEEP